MIWSIVGVSLLWIAEIVYGADPSLPTGRSINGHCMFSNPEVSFVWQKLVDSSGSYYEIKPLEDQKYVRPVTFPNQYYQLPQSFVDNRYTHPEEGHAPYLNHSSFKDKYDENFADLRKRFAFLNDLLNISMTRIPRRMAVFHDILTNNYGLIVRPQNCEYLRNGGCTYMRHNRIYNMNGRAKQHELVISLTAGAFGTWHFPMELFVGLAGVPKEYMEKAMFHVPAKSSFIHSWFSLINIPENRVISDPIVHAKSLLVPQMGRCCEPYETQIEWLRNDVAHLPEKHVSHEKEIILIQRSGSRQVTNVHDVEQQVRKFADEVKYKLIIHDDRQLPSLEEQIQRFSKATIVIAPHGAGMLFTAFSPSNACIIEFMPMINPECYARIAFIRRMKYMMYMMKDQQIRISDVEAGLRKCVDLAEADGSHNPEADVQVGGVPLNGSQVNF